VTGAPAEREVTTRALGPNLDDTGNGRYWSGEPYAQSPSHVQAMGSRGPPVALHVYGLNAPGQFVDRDGRSPELVVQCVVRAAGALILQGVFLSPSTGDKTVHCVFACEISKACGPGAGSLLGLAKEYCDHHRALPLCSTFEWLDITANQTGEGCAMDWLCAGPCNTCCSKRIGEAGIE
jgi:hypothetical protein